MSRREALIGRYRAGSMDRLKRLGVTLLELADGAKDAEKVKEVARELHTLKGESRMLGFARTAEVTHQIESFFLAARDDEGGVPKAACMAVVGALEGLKRAVAEERDEGLVNGALADASARVRPKDDGEQPASAVPPDQVSTTATVPSAVGPEPSAPSAPAAAHPTPEKWVQLNAQRVDLLVEELADFSARFRPLWWRVKTLAQSGENATSSATELRGLVEDFDRCQSQLSDITASAWALRLIPVEPMLVDLGSHARALASEQDKQLRVVVQAHGAQLERAVLDSLEDPLLHLVRNAVDHGLEVPDARGTKPRECTLRLHAQSEGHEVVISVADDGRGIEPGAVRDAAVRRGVMSRSEADALSDASAAELLFNHGFSTRADVTDVSGRGVGLDVVRTALEALGGTVMLSSTPGAGTTFLLTVPSTITKERVLVMEVDGALYALPSRQVLEVMRLADARPAEGLSGMTVRHEDDVLPLWPLMAAPEGPSTPHPWVVVVDGGNQHWAFSVPTIVGQQEIIRRPVDAAAAAATRVSAAGSLDDGRLVLILSLVAVVRDKRRSGATTVPKAAPARLQSVLVVDDSMVVRDLLTDLLRGAGFHVRTAENGRAGLGAVEVEVPDIILSDIDMPVMDGFEFLGAVRARLPTTPVLMLSTRASAEDRERASNLGANGYLVKSQFEETALVETVRRYLGRPM